MQNKTIYTFTLSLPYSDCENLYVTGINSVVITADSGERVQVPTKNLRPYVSRDGLKGRFRLVVNQHNKIESDSSNS